MEKIPVKIKYDGEQNKYGYGKGLWVIIYLNRLDEELFGKIKKRIEEKDGIISYVSSYEIIVVFPFSAGIENLESLVWEMGEKELKKYIWKAGINGGDYGFMLINYENSLYGSIFGQTVNETRKFLREENNYTIIINREIKIKDVSLETEDLRWNQFKYKGKYGNFRILSVSNYSQEDIGTIIKWGTPILISPGEVLPFIWIKIETDEEDILKFCMERSYIGGCIGVNIKETIIDTIAGDDIKILNNLLLDLPNSNFIFTDVDFEKMITKSWKEILKREKVKIIKKLSLNIETLKILSIFKKGIPLDTLKKVLGEKFRITSDIQVDNKYNIANTEKKLKIEDKEKNKIKEDIFTSLFSDDKNLKTLIFYYIEKKYEEELIDIINSIIQLYSKKSTHTELLDFIVKTLSFLPKEEDKNKNIIARLKLEKGKILKLMNRYSDAEEDFRYVMWATVGKHMEELRIESILELAEVLYLWNKFDDAEKWIMEEMSKAKESNYTILFLRGGLLLAKIYTAKRLYSKANSIITSLEKEIEPEKHTEILLNLLTIKSSIYIKEKQYDLARDTLLDAINISSKYGFQKEEIFQYINLGNIHLEKQNFEEAYHYFEIALKKAEQLNNKRGKLLALYNLGVVGIEKENYSLAQKYLSEGLKLCTEDKWQKILFLQALGDLKVHTKNFSGAEQYIKEALALTKETNSKVREALLLLRYGYIVGYLMRENEAIKYLKQSQKIFDKLKDEQNKKGAELNIIYFNIRKKDLSSLHDELRKFEDQSIKDEFSYINGEISIYRGNLKLVEDLLLKRTDDSSFLKLKILFGIHTGNVKSFTKNYRTFLKQESSIKDIVEVTLESLDFIINHKTRIKTEEILLRIDSIKDYIPTEINKLLNAYFKYFKEDFTPVEIKTENNIFLILSSLLNSRIYINKKQYEKAFNILKHAKKTAEKNSVNIYLWKTYLGLNHIILKRIVAREIFPDAITEATDYENKSKSIINKIKKDLTKETKELLDKEFQLWGL